MPIFKLPLEIQVNITLELGRNKGLKKNAAKKDSTVENSNDSRWIAGRTWRRH